MLTHSLLGSKHDALYLNMKEGLTHISAFQRFEFSDLAWDGTREEVCICATRYHERKLEKKWHISMISSDGIFFVA